MMKLSDYLTSLSIPWIRFNLDWYQKDGQWKKRPTNLPKGWNRPDFWNTERNWKPFQRRASATNPYLVFKCGTVSGIAIVDVDGPEAADLSSLPNTFKTASVSTLKDPSLNKHHLWFQHNPDYEIDRTSQAALDWKGAGLIFELDCNLEAEPVIAKLEEAHYGVIWSHLPTAQKAKSSGAGGVAGWADLHSNPESQPADPVPSDKELKTLSLEEFLLAIIPNHDQPAPVWRGMGYAIKGVGLTLQHFISWSHKSEKWSDQTEACTTLWNAINESEIRYNTGSLVKLASNYFPKPVDYYETHSLPCCVDGLPTIDFGTVVNYHERYCNSLLDHQEARVIVNHAHMGTGKTYGIKELLKHRSYPRILVLSPRRVFAKNLTNELNNSIAGEPIVCYLKLTKQTQFPKQDRLMVQLESLWKIQGCPPFDLVIIDEIEAVLRQFSSPTLTRAKQCAETFWSVLRSAGQVILSDAFISMKTVRLVEHLGLLADTTYLRNTYQPVKRRAVRVRDKKQLQQALLTDLRRGKRCVFFSASKQLLDDTLLRVTRKEIVPADRVKAYTGGGLRDNLEDVRREWSGKQLVMYNSAITVGVNFDVHDQFDRLYVYGSAYNCCNVEDVFQATLRVRHLTDNFMIYCLNLTPDHDSYPTTRQQAQRFLQTKHQTLTELQMDYPDAPSWLLDVHTDNLVEQGVSRMHYRATFNKFLEFCGYTRVEDREVSVSDELKQAVAADEIDIDDVDDIDDETQEAIKLKIYGNNATAAELAEFYKFQFDYFLFPAAQEHPEVRRRLFPMMFERREREQLWRFGLEMRQTPTQLFEAGEDLTFREMADITPVYLQVIRDLCSELGLRHSVDSKELMVADLMNKRDKIEKVLRPLTSVQRFIEGRTHDQERKGVKHANKWQAVVNPIAECFKGWTGAELKTKRSKKGALSKRKGYPVVQLESPISDQLVDTKEHPDDIDEGLLLGNGDSELEDY